MVIAIVAVVVVVVLVSVSISVPPWHDDTATQQGCQQRCKEYAFHGCPPV
jgi:hypothetical protein